MEGAGYNLALIMADTNELQTDWKNTGRLDNLLDAIPTTAMRGTDGANTTIPDAAGVAPTVGEIRQEMDTNSTKMAPSQVLGDYKATGFNTTTPPTVGEIKTEMEGVGSKILAIETDTNELQTDLVDGGRLDLLFDRMLDVMEIKHGLSVNDPGGAATTTKFISTLTEGEGFPWERAAVLFTSGVNSGLMRRIKAYNGTTKEITLQTSVSAAPADNDTFVMPAVRAFITPDIEDIADQVCDELLADHVGVGSLAKGVSDILADTDDLQTSQGAWTTATTTALSVQGKLDVNAEVVDVIRTDTSSEPAQGAPDTTPTLETMIKYIYFKMINKTETTASEDAMYNTAGDTKVIKAAISDNGTTFTKAEYVSGV
jgi:hypothetical protein